jgi:transglutaminase-like putative cysteine protease
MKERLTLYSLHPDEYLEASSIIDFDNDHICELSDRLAVGTVDEIAYIKAAYEYVRDNISHSADIQADELTCSASEVLAAKHGTCFAKSHLLAALLRRKGIPTGFCYQRLILDDESAPILIYHGLNGVYLKEYKKWIRLDPRGNREDVNAQFGIDEEHLAFPVRTNKGEEDGFVIFSRPDKNILDKFQLYKTRTELWHDFPSELAYSQA